MIDTLIDMMKEFDYKKNTRDDTIKFLLYMIQQFMEVKKDE